MNQYKAIGYKGINRAAGRYGSDGLCEEQINACRRSGMLRPVGDKTMLNDYAVDLSGYSILYRHPVLPSYDLVGVSASSNKLHRIKSTGVPDVIDIKDKRGFDDSSTVQSITHLGNILTITTENGAYWFKYDPVTDAYSQLKDIPIPQFYLIHDTTRQKASYNLGEFESFNDAVADYIETADRFGNLGYIEGHTLTIAAWKMADGSYIRRSQPVHCYCGNKDIYLYQSGDSITADHAFYNTSFAAIVGQCKFTDDQITNLGSWKGVITSLCFFMTRPKSNYVIDTDEGNYTPDGGNYYPPVNETEIKRLMEDEVNYYLVHEIGFDDVIEDLDHLLNMAFDLGNVSNLATKESLPVDQFTHHQLSGETFLQYNSRLHIGNTRTILGDGWNTEAFLNSFRSMLIYDEITVGSNQATNSQYVLYLFWYLNTEEGEKIVRMELTTPNVWTITKEYILLNPILAYPDYRATKVVIFTLDTNDGTYYLPTNNTFHLKPHSFLNIAYYSNYNATDHFLEPIMVPVTTPDSPKTIDDLPTEDDTYTDLNRMAVSLPDNPFIFAAENSYRIGSLGNEILAIRTLGEAISEGQFGQFPLYVFTESGIYTVQQGSTGEVLYAAINALSADVPLSGDAIIQTGGSVVYATTRGLFEIAGNQIKEIGAALEGRIDNPLSSKGEYLGYLDDPSLVELSDKLCSMSFIDFLSGCILGYDPIHREVMVSHPLLDSTSSSTVDMTAYSFVYSRETGEWYKIDRGFSAFLNAYPDTWGVDYDKVYSLGQEGTGDREVLIQTRPMTLGQRSFKKIVCLVQNGYFETDDERFTGVYLYGSQDGKRWFILCGKQLGGNFAEIQTRRASNSCRYFIVILAGKLSLDSVIDGVEFEYTDRFMTRLR